MENKVITTYYFTRRDRSEKKFRPNMNILAIIIIQFNTHFKKLQLAVRPGITQTISSTNNLVIVMLVDYYIKNIYTKSQLEHRSLTIFRCRFKIYFAVEIFSYAIKSNKMSLIYLKTSFLSKHFSICKLKTRKTKQLTLQLVSDHFYGNSLKTS